MKKYAKVITILLIVMTIYTIFVYAINKNSIEKPKGTNGTNGNEEPSNDNPTSDLLLAMNPNIVLSYSKEKWGFKKLDDYSNEYFDLYDNSDSIGQYSFMFNEKLYIKDSSNNFYDKKGIILGVKTNLEYSVLPHFYSDMDDNDEKNIKEILDSKEIVYEYNDLSIKKVQVDSNKDGIRETIYSVSNAFSEHGYSFNKTFGIVFINDYKGNTIVYENITGLDELLTTCSPYYVNTIEFNKKRDLIINCEYYSMNGSKVMIYDLNNNMKSEFSEEFGR